MAEPACVSPGAPSKPPSKARRLLKRTMIYLLIIYLAWLWIGFFIQRRILFPRYLVQEADASWVTAIISYGAETLTIDSPQGSVQAWFIPGKDVSAETPGPVVIFAHGNGELIDHWPHELSAYTEMGINVLLPEFRGYGRSQGDPSQKRIAEDFAAFYDMVIERPDVDASRVVIHGRSIGGGVASQLAADRPSAALILQSSPSSIRRMAARLLVPWFLVRDPFNSVPVVRDYPNPVLVMHGSQDRIIPPSHATRLANAATNPKSKLILYDTDHNTIPPADTYWQDIEQFLKDADVFE